jgi:hypothetical protein
MLLVLLLLCSAPAVLGDATSTLLWPRPKTVQCQDGAPVVSASLSVTAPNAPAPLAASIAYYTQLYHTLVAKAPAQKGAAVTITGMTITTASSSVDLTPSTSYKCVAAAVLCVLLFLASWAVPPTSVPLRRVAAAACRFLPAYRCGVFSPSARLVPRGGAERSRCCGVAVPGTPSTSRRRTRSSP